MARTPGLRCTRDQAMATATQHGRLGSDVRGSTELPTSPCSDSALASGRLGWTLKPQPPVLLSSHNPHLDLGFQQSGQIQDSLHWL